MYRDIFIAIAAPTENLFIINEITIFIIEQQNFFLESIYILINTLIIELYRSSGRKSNPDLQSASNSLILANFESSNCSFFTEIQIGLINSSLAPSLTRAPNQFAWAGIEALHFVSLIVKSTFLSISQSSTNIKSVKLFRPAWTDVQLQINMAHKNEFFKTSEGLRA